jgi:hypothetical protein
VEETQLLPHIVKPRSSIPLVISQVSKQHNLLISTFVADLSTPKGVDADPYVGFAVGSANTQKRTEDSQAVLVSC